MDGSWPYLESTIVDKSFRTTSFTIKSLLNRTNNAFLGSIVGEHTFAAELRILRDLHSNLLSNQLDLRTAS